MTDFFILATGGFAVVVALRLLTLHRARRDDGEGDTEI